MKKIIGFTDSITECECCGKSGLKGTFCVEINGVESYYGSTCAFKKHGVSQIDGKNVMYQYKREQALFKLTGFKTFKEWEDSQI